MICISITRPADALATIGGYNACRCDADAPVHFRLSYCDWHTAYRHHAAVLMYEIPLTNTTSLLYHKRKILIDIGIERRPALFPSS